MRTVKHTVRVGVSIGGRQRMFDVSVWARDYRDAKRQVIAQYLRCRAVSSVPVFNLEVEQEAKR